MRTNEVRLQKSSLGQSGSIGTLPIYGVCGCISVCKPAIAHYYFAQLISLLDFIVAVCALPRETSQGKESLL